MDVHQANLLSFPNILAGLTLYFLLEKAMKHVHCAMDAKFYDQLRNTRKDLPYFAFLMGILITTISTPSCLYAAAIESSGNTSLTHYLFPFFFVPSNRIPNSC
jgi:hypothetical protein